MNRCIKIACLSVSLSASAHAMYNNNFDLIFPPMDPKEKQCLELIEAALKGNNEKIKELIELGVPLTYTKNGWPALSFAVTKKHFACVQTLLAAGAPVNQLRGQSELSPLIIATSQGNAECVQALIAARADVNQKNKGGLTAIMLAAANGDLVCLDMLLKAGAKVNEVNRKGVNALGFAASQGKTHCIKPLIDAGARIIIASSYRCPFSQWTPIMYAIKLTNDADCSSICNLVIDAMLRMPTKEQKAQMTILFGINKFRKPLELDKYLRNELKKAFSSKIYLQNRANFAGSIVYQELMFIKDLREMESHQCQQRIAALLEKYNPGGNNAGSTSWCSVQ